MRSLLPYIPLIAGLGIVILGYKLIKPKGPGTNRPAFGLTLIVGSFFWWLSTAMLLVYEGKYYMAFNALTVIAFFTGVAFFFPPPPHATRANQHSVPGHILIWVGVILGFAHSLALLFIPEWSARLIAFYAVLGLHGAPPPTS